MNVLGQMYFGLPWRCLVVVYMVSSEGCPRIFDVIFCVTFLANDRLSTDIEKNILQVIFKSNA